MNRQIAIVGAGPRGLSVLERLCANFRESGRDNRAHEVRKLVINLVDPWPPGGAVWRTDQQPELLMNTVACQVTLFTDPSVTCAGPVVTGPSLYEWAQLVAVVEDVEPCSADVAAEASRLGPDDYASRSFYGHYLEWVYRHLAGTAPRGVTVAFHRSRALAVHEDEDGQRVVLDTGHELTGLDAVVLAQGHLPAAPGAKDLALRRSARARGLLHLPPANPVDLDLDAVRAGEPVILRGLGLNFFDHVARLTEGRGGTFHQDDEGRLVYEPSGREPQLFAGSRRGVPHHARGDNQKGAHGRYQPRLLTPAYAAELHERGGLSFRGALWPLIRREVESVYYTALLRSRGRHREAQWLGERILGPDWSCEARATWLHLRSVGIRPADTLDWQRLLDPLALTVFPGRGELDAWMVRRLDEDADQAALGNIDGPLKAALDAMRDLRNEIRMVIDRDGLDGESHRADVHGWYTPLNAFLAVGPPRRRVEELAALTRAGVLGFLGRRTSVRVGTDAFEAHSPTVPDATVRARVLIEARLPDSDVRTADDPLLRGLLATGQAQGFRLTAASGATHHTGGLQVDRDHRLVTTDGTAHPARFAVGIPTEGLHWLTAAGARPGVDSVMLRETDAVARGALGLSDEVRAGRGRITA